MSLRHIQIAEWPYFLTTATHARRQFFQSHDPGRIVCEVLVEVTREESCALHAYVVMPDHVHAIVTLGSNCTLARLMQKIKGRSAWRMGRVVKTDGRVWQKGYWDHCIRNEADFTEKLRYIIDNPVKAGLVSQPEQYRLLWWDMSHVGLRDRSG